MTAADSYAPAYGHGTAAVKVTTAFTVAPILDAWLTQPFLPVANTAMGRWLMDEVGYVEPRFRMHPGRQFPTTTN